MNEIFDRELLRARRLRAASKAGAHDFLLQRVAGEFAERLAAVNREFSRVLVLGAWNGLIGSAISGTQNIGGIIEADSAPALMRGCGNARIVADEEYLPFRDQSLDLVLSGLTLQFVNDLPGALVQIRRALRPDGLFQAAVIGGRTLGELRESFVAAEDEITGGVSPRVAPFADVRELGSLLQRAGFALPVVDADVLTARYESPLALMRELRGMGAGNILLARERKPLRRAVLFRACEIYSEKFGEGGRVTATFEIIYLTGWAPHESQQKPLAPGSAKMRLADALGVSERSLVEKAQLLKKSDS